VVEIGGSHAVDRRQSAAFWRTQNEAHRIKNVNKIIFCASTKYIALDFFVSFELVLSWTSLSWSP